MKQFKNVFEYGLLAFMVLGMSYIVIGSIASKSYQFGQIGFNWGKETNASRCNKVGKVIVNVTERVENSVDSGIAGNYWAFDNFNRNIQVWPESDNLYCILVTYHGNFDSQDGQTSPGGTSTLNGDEDGQFQGGYRATVVGNVKLTPPWPVRGNVGVHDYQCDINGDCPAYVNWLDQYFEPGYSFSYQWWGWTYRAGRHGTWINSAGGNEGDIF